MTLEQINASLNTKFTLIKRDGTVNESNAKIVKRLSNLTEADIERFKKTDGWNMTPSEKHAKGYHALRALDKWYRENKGSENDDGDASRGAMPNDGMPSERPSESAPSEDESENTPSENTPSESESGNRESESAPSENGDGESESESSESGDGESESGSESSDGESSDGESESAPSENESESSENESESSENESAPSENETPSEENKPKPNAPKLTDTEKQVLAMITRSQANDKPNNVYLYGPAGTGKSYMVKRIADAIDAGYWETGIVAMKEELLGYGDAHGNYVETECVKILKNGVPNKDLTIMLFDEFDGMPNAVTLAWNNIFASRRFTTSQGTFNVHPSIRFVATGNTSMDGADEFYDRETVDKSVKTRWIFKNIDYDKRVERKLADADVVEFLQGLRRAKDNCGLDLFVTYREFTALQWAKSVIADNIMTTSQALDSCVFKGLTEDDKDTLRGDRMIQKLIENGNVWARAF